MVRLRLDAGPDFHWLPGQYVNVRRGDGVTRSYSLASCAEEDYFLDLHVRRHADGVMSRWLCDEVSVGAELEVQGPNGRCHYRRDEPDRSLLLIAGGTGLGPLVAIVRDALRHNHRGPIFLYHGARSAAGLYLDAELRGLAAQHRHFHYCGCTSEQQDPHHPHGLVSDVALARHPQLPGWRIFLAGSADMVHTARWQEIGKTRGRAVAGLDLVVASPVVYASATIDVTDAVLARLKRDFDARKPAP